jgi:hypothetical protein
MVLYSLYSLYTFVHRTKKPAESIDKQCTMLLVHFDVLTQQIYILWAREDTML